MKGFFLFTIWLSISISSHSQQFDNSYKDLRRLADSLYRADDFMNAAVTYSKILRLPKFNASIWDYNNAAFSWARAGIIDSALFNLEMISNIDTVTYSDYLDIVDDGDYKNLKSVSRWDQITNKIFDNAKADFYKQIKVADEKTIFHLNYYAAKAWILNQQLDSSFQHLNKIATSKFLTFENADNILKNGLLKKLHTDKRWNAFKNKMFQTLSQKYVPSNTFKNLKSKNILIDGAHYNFHDINGTYEVLSGMLNKIGFVVTGQIKPFDESNLQSFDILIIANPLADRMDSLTRRAQRNKEPFRWSAVATQSAFAESEISAIKNWVYNGGALLLILDHAPYGKSGGLLAEVFGVETRNVGTYDTLSLDPKVDTANGARNILFTRSNGLIGNHIIMNGVDSVTTYTGESLVGPSNSSVLLQLPSTAIDRDWLPETRQFRNRTAAGRSQGIAFEFGKGRVVVMGEAAEFRPVYLSRSERGNWQFLLNILKWLSNQ